MKKKTEETLAVSLLLATVAAIPVALMLYSPSYEPVDGEVVERMVLPKTNIYVINGVGVPEVVDQPYVVVDHRSSDGSEVHQRFEVSSGIYASCWEGLYFHRDRDGSISCDTEPG